MNFLESDYHSRQGDRCGRECTLGDYTNASSRQACSRRLDAAWFLTPLPVPAAEPVVERIYFIRAQRVMVDRDLAALYGVETRALVQAVKRNLGRFPADFMFQLSPEELENWRSQIVMSNSEAKMGLRRPPYAFSEHGALQLASALNSRRAVEMSIVVVRAFVRLREVLATHKELAVELKKLERRLDLSDEAIAKLYEMIRKLMQEPPAPPKRRIGF